MPINPDDDGVYVMTLSDCLRMVEHMLRGNSGVCDGLLLVRYHFELGSGWAFVS